MKDRKLFTQIFSSFLIVVVLAIITFGGYEYSVSRDYYTSSVVSDLAIRAKLVAQIIKNDNLLTDPTTMEKSCREISHEAGVRITVISPDGKVLCDSHKNPEYMDNHRSRPEVIKAFDGKQGYSIRYSSTLGKKLIYVALPFRSNGKINAVIRVAMPLSEFETVLFGVKNRLIWIGLIILSLTALASYIISKRVSAPLEKIQRGTERFIKGDFSKLPLTEGSDEIVALANSFNRMAEELDKRINTISLQKSEQEAMFLSMKEGVLAINSSERIININQAALKFFQIKSEAEEVNDRPVYEIIRNKEMLDFIYKSLNTREHLEEEIIVYSDKERVLLVNADPLSTAQNEIIGTIVVMNDITRVKEWDKMRQDFVANVSHELKTPITSIKGYVETLLNGDVSDKKIEKKFLTIVDNRVNQLNAIIDDLLQLSKLDKTASIEKKKELLLPIINNAVQYSPKTIDEKNIRIDIDCPENLEANINAVLLERALVNLIDNAVKYSDKDGRVLITVKQSGTNILIIIKDWGIGIPSGHHSRLFERFYRVDKGRSRELGGTGLGLSIVKHIVLAHKGKVTVESAPEKGSSFTIILPTE